jgi:hypothetical protein
MKRMLLILMILASAAMADDRQIKALLIGNWIGDYHCKGRDFTFQSDGKWLIVPGGDDDSKWDVKGGKLIATSSDQKNEYYTILFLSKHEFLARGDDHDQVYLFLTRDDD